MGSSERKPPARAELGAESRATAALLSYLKPTDQVEWARGRVDVVGSAGGHYTIRVQQTDRDDYRFGGAKRINIDCRLAPTSRGLTGPVCFGVPTGETLWPVGDRVLAIKFALEADEWYVRRRMNRGDNIF